MIIWLGKLRQMYVFSSNQQEEKLEPPDLEKIEYFWMPIQCSFHSLYSKNI